MLSPGKSHCVVPPRSVGFDVEDVFWGAKTVHLEGKTVYGNIGGITGETRQRVFELYDQGR
jgi:hypothetical protein